MRVSRCAKVATDVDVRRIPQYIGPQVGALERFQKRQLVILRKCVLQYCKVGTRRERVQISWELERKSNMMKSMYSLSDSRKNIKIHKDK